MIINLGDINKAVAFRTNGLTNCLDLCKLILKKYGLTSYGSSSNVFKLMYEDKGVLKHYGTNIRENYKKAIECIDRHLEKGRPIIVGVNYILNRGYNEGATDHFVVIYGKGYDNDVKKTFYVYYEVGKTDINEVYNEEKNRFYFIDEETPYLCDYEASIGNKSRFDVTQIRPNDGILDGTINQKG